MTMRPALIGLVVLATGPLTLAQEPAVAPPAPSVSRYLGLHAFPAKDQVAAQQQKDELECYRWAAQDSGFDPLAAAGEQPPVSAPPSARQDKPSTAGGAAKGAVAGAAAGAIIGAIAGDTSKGAGIGAGTGLLGGIVIAKHKQKEARKEADREQASQQAATKAETQQKLDGFKKAYGACMEAKSYVVK
jgi:Glycine-zipper domain